MTVAPPQEVSTQVKLVFPAHRSLAAQTWAEDACREKSRHGEEHCAHACCLTRSSCRRVPLSHQSSWELAPADRFHASPPLKFSGEIFRRSPMPRCGSDGG